jgi:hypothetical protein
MASDSPIEPLSKAKEGIDAKRFEVALRLAQVCAAWAQVIGVMFAALAAVYAINNNLLSIKNSELEAANRTLVEASENLSEEISTREERLEDLEKDYAAISEISRQAKIESVRLEALAGKSAASAKRSRQMLVAAYKRALDEFISFQALADSLRRAYAGDIAPQEPDQEGIYFNAESPRESTFAIPNYVRKYETILSGIKADPSPLGLDADSEAFQEALNLVKAELQKHQSHLVCEKPDLDLWKTAFEREISRDKDMMDIAESAILQSGQANGLTEQQLLKAKSEKRWLKERNLARKMAQESWLRSVTRQYYGAWWKAMASCKFNFEHLPNIASGAVRPRMTREMELLPPIPLEKERWESREP